MEDLDDERHLVIKENQLQNLKDRLGRVKQVQKGARRVLTGILVYDIGAR